MFPSLDYYRRYCRGTYGEQAHSVLLLRPASLDPCRSVCQSWKEVAPIFTAEEQKAIEAAARALREQVLAYKDDWAKFEPRFDRSGLPPRSPRSVPAAGSPVPPGGCFRGGPGAPQPD